MTLAFHRLQISDIQKETSDTISLAFEIPQKLKNNYQFNSGQYLTLRTTIDGEEIRRSYSLCSAPYENEWRVAIKKVKNGKFSDFANNTFKVGQELDVMTPTGHFQVHINETNQKTYILFAAGSGITPIISIIKSILKFEPKSNVMLFYGNKNSNSIIFKEQLEALKNEHMSNFRLVHIFSRETIGNQLQKGRINSEKCEQLKNNFLKFEKDNIENCEVFICGPEDMILAVKESMINFGIPPKQIHFELFGTNLIKIEKKESKQDGEKEKISSNVRIIIDGDALDINLDSDSDTILDAAHKAGADLPFSCKGGVCSTCKAKILEGTVRMDINYALEEDEIEAGFILTCQAHPTSEKLVLSFDE